MRAHARLSGGSNLQNRGLSLRWFEFNTCHRASEDRLASTNGPAIGRVYGLRETVADRGSPTGRAQDGGTAVQPVRFEGYGVRIGEADRGWFPIRGFGRTGQLRRRRGLG
jgi:hypothetical protein